MAWWQKRRSWLMASMALLLLAATGGLPLRAQEGTRYHQSASDPVRAQTSGDCIQCHDGSLAQDAFDPRFNHPIEIDYLSRLALSGGRLRPIGSALRLEDGKVGCITCHDLDSGLPAKLAISNERSDLCLTCHNP